MMAEKRITLELRSHADKPLGKLIQYLEEHPEGKNVGRSALMACLMPLVLDTDSEDHRKLAISYIEQCAAYVQAAKVLWGLDNIEDTAQNKHKVSANISNDDAAESPTPEAPPPPSKPLSQVLSFG